MLFTLLTFIKLYYDFNWKTNKKTLRTYKPKPLNVKPLAKRTWVYLRLLLARPCVPLRWLAMNLRSLSSRSHCTQVDASFSPLGHPTQVNPIWVTPINLLLANEIQSMSAFKGLVFVINLSVLARKLGSPFGHATQSKSLRKFNLRPLATTCRSVLPGLCSYSHKICVILRLVRLQVYIKVHKRLWNKKVIKDCFAHFITSVHVNGNNI